MTCAVVRNFGMSSRSVLWRRLWARALDLLFAGISTYLPMFLLFLAVAVFGFNPFDSGTNVLGTIWLLVSSVGMVMALVFEAWMLSRVGHTPGKRILHIRVSDAGDDALPSFYQALVRSAVPIASAAVGALFGIVAAMYLKVPAVEESGIIIVVGCGGVAWLLIYLSSAFDSEGRGWHDKAAVTVAVTSIPRVSRRIDDEMNQRWKDYLHRAPKA